MSAPAGWYPTPEGHQRYWDGSAWTDHVRTPGAEQAPTTALPQQESGSGYAAPQGAQPSGTGAAGQGYAASPGQAYGTPGYGQPGGAYATGAYGSAGPVAEPKKGKGCLIAGIIAAVVAVILIMLAIWGVRAINKKVDEVRASFSYSASEAPSLSSEQPPSSDPSATTDSPTTSDPLTGTVYGIGEAITEGSNSVAAGWTLTKEETLGWTQIENMTTTGSDDTGLWLVHAVDANNVELDETICTFSSGETTVSCLPFLSDVTAASGIIIESAG